MTMLYFDGFDQYAAIPEPTASAPCSTARGVANQATVAADPAILTTINAYTSYCKLYGEDKVWRLPQVPTATTSALGSHQYTNDRLTPIYTRADSIYGLMLNAGQPVLQQKKLVIGFKIKHADNQYRTSSYNLPLAVFSSTTAFTTTYGTWAVILSGSNIQVKPLIGGSTTGYTFNNVGQASWPTTYLPAGQDDLGPSNFVTGATGSTPTNPCNPPIEQLASNTVEIEITDLGKVSVWINNQFIGSSQFIGGGIQYITGVQYVKVGLLPSYYVNVTGSISYTVFSGVTDMYLLNGMGTTNNKRLGKVKVLSRRPVTDSSVQFTRPDTANTNAEIAATVPPTFGKSLTGVKQGDTDLYASTAFNFTNEAILAASIVTTGYKTDPQGNDIAPVLRVGGTNFTGNTNIVPISASLMKTEQSIFELNPKTNLPFTKSDIDASTFGVTVVPPTVVE